jgi:hypothetical protein
LIVFGLAFFIAGLVLTARNFRDRSRVSVLQAKLQSSEFSCLVMAITLTALTFIALAFLPLMQRGQSTVEYSASSKPAYRTMPVEVKPPNLSPPGVPQTIGDVFKIASLLFVLLPVGLIALPLFMKRNRFRGVVEGLLATVLAAFCVIGGFSIGLFFLPTTAAMLAAAAFAREKLPST